LLEKPNVFNNPFVYRDPDGQFAFVIPLLIWGAEFVLPTLSVCITPIVYGAVIGTVAYGGYQLVQKLNESTSLSTCILATPMRGGYLYQINDSYILNKTKKGSVDPELPENPDDLAKKPGWKETTHPEAGANGKRTFENDETGEKIRHDAGTPGKPGHEGHDHYHRPNPNTTGWHDKYLDSEGNPVKGGESHLYAPEKVWWK
jgi:hypothetical protein